MRQVTLAVVALALAGALACALAQLSTPVQSKQTDLLALVFGDARQMIGQQLLNKADSYFHGGVDIDCHEHEHEHDEVEELHDEADHLADGDQHHEDEHHEDEEAHAAPARWDLWSRINAQVHVQEHRHLQGEQMQELVPWLWASIHAAPHYVEAYLDACYILKCLKMPATTRQEILLEGIKQNPESAALECDLAELYRTDLPDPAASIQAYDRALRKAVAAYDAKRDLEEARFQIFTALLHLIPQARANAAQQQLDAYIVIAKATLQSDPNRLAMLLKKAE